MNNAEYLKVIRDIKSRIHEAQHRAVLAANRELIMLNWYIGKTINEHSSWGSKFIDNLARDIKIEFPATKGYSARNLKYMAKFAKTYPDIEFVQTVSAQISWSHNTTLLDKVKDNGQRVWYAKKAIEDGWTLSTLEYQIEYRLYERQALAEKTSNFSERLPDPQSKLAEQTMKDPYIFDFIDFRQGMVEREIESELVKNITRLLLELGTGFAFVGNQYHIEVENEDFYIDLLFYNIKLHCYVVIELKNGDFKPEYAGKLNFYISAVDDLLKTSHDNPTIGILLCKNKKGMIAEYSLRDIEKPIGVSEFKLFDRLPKEYENVLPSPEDIERRIGLLLDDQIS
jgi:predicted nuclease of restriction endonuclease-like (RecB) superfamily